MGNEVLERTPFTVEQDLFLVRHHCLVPTKAWTLSCEEFNRQFQEPQRSIDELQHRLDYFVHETFVAIFQLYLWTCVEERQDWKTCPMIHPDYKAYAQDSLAFTPPTSQRPEVLVSEDIELHVQGLDFRTYHRKNVSKKKLQHHCHSINELITKIETGVCVCVLLNILFRYSCFLNI